MKKNREHIDWINMAAKLCEEPNTSDKNAPLPDDIKEIQQSWKQIQLNNTPKLDVDAAWKNLSSEIDKTSNKSTPFNNSFLKIAASIIVLFTIGYATHLILKKSQPIYKTYQTEKIESPRNIVLKDGSLVVTNHNTTLITPVEFTKNERLVSLKGEAFFDIKHQNNIPFIIKTSQGEILVTGTEFSVKTTPDNSTEVYVVSGSVEISQQLADIKLKLLPGEIGYITPEKLYKTQNKNANYLAWKTKKLLFKAEKLESVAKIIGEIYQKKIIFNDSTLMPLLLTTTFTNEPLEKILTTIELVFDIEICATENEIILSKKNSK